MLLHKNEKPMLQHHWMGSKALSTDSVPHPLPCITRKENSLQKIFKLLDGCLCFYYVFLYVVDIKRKIPDQTVKPFCLRTSSSNASTTQSKFSRLA